VVVVTEDGTTPEAEAALAACGDAVRIISSAQYTAESQLEGCPHVYQIGNNPDHVFVYEAFNRKPGVLVQHDFNLHYLVEDTTLARGDSAGYRRIMREEYGEAGATLADLREIGIFSESQKLTLPLNRHLLHRAQGVIVHNRWVYDRMPAATRARTLVVPHHFSPTVVEVEGLTQAEAREKLGLPADGFMVLSIGFITPPKQVQATLAALARLRDQGASFYFVVAGERNPSFDIDTIIRQHGLEDRVVVTGYVEESAFFQYIVAADCLVNLRHPTVGESSGTLARALALGLPAIVHNFGPSSEFPDDVVLKVPLEQGEPVALAATLNTLMGNPALRRTYGAAAQRHMLRHCAVEHSADAYLRFIRAL
jgi:glycosyltransferase involved in cell wall biosynthesis